MISSVYIENFKSIQKLSIDMGRFNVIIGENGCGKSNILEAVALYAAAASGKLDNEFLASRGIRVTSPMLMRSAFKQNSSEEPIELGIKYWETEEEIKSYRLENDNKQYSKWKVNSELGNKMYSILRKDLSEKLNKDIAEEIYKLLQKDFERKELEALNITIKDALQNELSNKTELLEFLEIDSSFQRNRLKGFMIYSPENTALRNFYKEGQVEPLGINGEGLLKLLKIIKDRGDKERLREISDSLELFDWFEGLEIPSDFSASEDKVKLIDRYITNEIDQRSANEGFLFVLFYITLIISEDTPSVFAIDNVDASLNPKLCTKLTKELIRLSKKYDKQLFVTSHNPAILDGIDLGDSEQRLLVTSRNKQGHTVYKRILPENKPKSASGEPLKLSEALLRGYLGGLPKGF